MHIVVLPDLPLYEYLQFVMHKHTTGGLEPDELPVANALWQCVKGAKEIDTAAIEAATAAAGPEVIKVPGPLSVVHNGDLQVPVSAEQAQELQK